MAGAPLLVVGHVISLDRENGPRFTGDPKGSAPVQKMTAEVEVLRFVQQPGVDGTTPTRRLKIRFVGRDGPDFSLCPTELPRLEPGQTLLLPLRSNGKGPSEPWELNGVDGGGLTTRVAGKMSEPALTDDDPRSFITREFVNSFRSGDPIARVTAASLVAWQGDYLEPKLSAQLKRSIGNNKAGWARVLASIIISYPSRVLTIDEIESGRLELSRRPRFKGLPLAQLARSRLPDRKVTERMVWRSLMADLSGFADEPYHLLFSYNYNLALHPAIQYLSRYRDDPSLIQMVKVALCKDRPGSSALAAILITKEQKACLPQALDRAMKVIRRPEANGDDVFSAIQLVLRYGTEDQRRQYASLTSELKSVNPDYAAFLQLKLSQSLGDLR
jgi:hypothetical protein